MGVCSKNDSGARITANNIYTSNLASTPALRYEKKERKKRTASCKLLALLIAQKTHNSTEAVNANNADPSANIPYINK